MKNYLLIILLLLTLPVFAQQPENKGNSDPTTTQSEPTNKNTETKTDEPAKEGTETKTEEATKEGQETKEEAETKTEDSITVSIPQSEEVIVKDAAVLEAVKNYKLEFEKTKRTVYKKTKNAKEALIAGQAAASKGKYGEAINYYFGAQAFDPDKRKEVTVLVEEAFIEIAALRYKAEVAKAEAVKQKGIAEKARIVAVAAEQEAIKQKDIAEKAQKDAELSRDEAVKQRGIAETERKVAEEARERAEIAEADALKAKKEAEEARDEAERLRLEALASYLAAKSMDIEYDDRLQSLLALEAFKLSSTVTSEIYAALHKAIEDRDHEFNELEGYHTGGVTAILQQDTTKYYTTGGDGKLIKWEQTQVVEVGKPTLDYGIVLNETNPSLSATLEYNGKRLALGGRGKKLQFIETKDIKTSNKSKQGEKIIYKGVNTNKYNVHGKATVYDVEFYKNDFILSIGRDNCVRTYNTSSNKEDVLIQFDTISDQLAIYFDTASTNTSSDFMAVGSRSGRLDIYDIRSTGDTIAKELKLTKHLPASISALEFGKVENIKFLTVGLKNGSVRVFVLTDAGLKFEVFEINAHKLPISSISFNKKLKTTKPDPIQNPYDFNIDFNQNTKEESNTLLEYDLAIGSYDGTISLWTFPVKKQEFINVLYTAKKIRFEDAPLILRDQGTWVTSLSFDEHHSQLIAGYLDGTIKFWSLDVQALADKLWCEYVSIIPEDQNGNKLSDLEKKLYLKNVNLKKMEYKNKVECSEVDEKNSINQ